MFETSPFVGYIIIAFGTLLLYGLAWIGSRGGSVYENAFIRIGLGLLVVLPILAAALFGALDWGRKDVAAPAGGAQSPPAASAPKPASTPAAKPATDQDRAATARRAAEEEQGKRQAEEARRAKAAEAAARAAAATEEAAKAAERTRSSGAPPQPASPAPAPAPAPPTPAASPATPSAPPPATPPSSPATPTDPGKQGLGVQGLGEGGGGKGVGNIGAARRAPQPSMPPSQAAQPEAATRSAETPPPASDAAPQPTAPPPAAAQPDRRSTATAPDKVAAAAAEARWDVVPVFYGTDRKRQDAATRIDYGAERAKTLELGHALVTVPKSHEVPNVERPWVYRVPFTSIVLYREKEDPARHFTIKELKHTTREEFLTLIRQRLAASSDFKNHAIVFVHGFNNSFDNALYRTAQIAYDLKFDGAQFLYSWPSKGQLGVSDYSYDRESAGQAQPHLRRFLDLVVRETGATSVSVIAHSMGSQLLLPVLRDLRQSTPEGIVISQVILAAPDVDRDTFEFLAGEIKGVSRGITLLAASNDRALTVSRNFWGGVPRAGDVPIEGPLVLAGIDTIDVTSISTDVLAINHSGYAEKQALLNDMRLLIQTGERPPEKRIPILQRIPTPRGDYWRYP